MYPIAFLFRPIFGGARVHELHARLTQKISLPMSIWNSDVHPYEGGDIGPHPLQIWSEGLPSDLPAPKVIAGLARQCVTLKGTYLVLGQGRNIAACMLDVKKR